MTRQLRYEGPRIEELLDRIRTDQGPDARILSADRVRTGGFGGFFPKETFEVIVECDDAPQVMAPSDVDGFAAVLARMVEDPAPEAVSEDTPHDTPHDAPHDASEAADVPFVPEPAASHDFLASALAAAPEVPEIPDRPGGPPVPLLPPAAWTAQPQEQSPVDLTDPLSDHLTDLDEFGGVTDLCGPIELDEAFEMLTHRVDAVVPTIPITGTVMVVGERDEAVRVACQLAGSVGQHQRDVLVAGPGRDRPLTAATVARVVSEAARRADRRARTPGPRFVVLELQPGLAGHRWATEVISIVAPTQVRMAIAGWRLAEQEARTVRALRRVDAIDLIGLESSVAPEAFLDLDAPVATLDGEPATPELWTALLVSVGRIGALASYDEPATTVPEPVSLRR